MINEKDIELANNSYIKKDFYQIFPELLELVSTYTERWEPASSNESDPGVVLLKLAAFVADKNNYNIDKNILEDFMVSCTQEESMRKLCDMMGYDMKYYQSATTYITFKYYGQVDDVTGLDKLDGADRKIELPAYDTVVSDKEGTISFILLDNVNITLDTPEATVPAIQGKLRVLQLGSNNVVHLNNLDSNNRLYLPLSVIAENGIFVHNAGEESSPDKAWSKRQNLNIEHTNNKVWKFGFDSSKSLPYIEFPKDIADLIGEGLVVRYLETLGEEGNIGANKIRSLNVSNDKLYVDASGEVFIDLSGDNSSSVLSVSNASAALNGASKETLNQAYKNFKKTIGTFNTLVTCRDYANAIYNMVDDADGSTPLVGNIQVSDIRDDLNYSDTVVTYGTRGLSFSSVSKTDEDDEDLISNFDLILYPFGRISNMNAQNSYDSSFKYFAETLSDIKLNLRDNKTISHNIRLPEDSDLVCIKQLYDLKAKITTTRKVNNLEEVEILTNIFTNIYKHFNSREIEFGDAIPFDSIYEVIKDADVRIKNVSLEEPEISSYAMTKAGNTYPLSKEENSTLGRKHYLDLISGNVLSGHLPLLNYFKDLKYYYGQTELEDVTPLITPVKQISTNLEITDVSMTSGYELKENEIIQFIAPSLATDVTYPYTVNYFLVLDRGEGSSSRYVINENEEYQLGDNDKLYINYTSSNDDDEKVVIDVLYTKNKIMTWKNSGKNGREEKTVPFNIIKPNFALSDTMESRSSTSVWAKTKGSYFLDGGELSGKGMNQLGVSQQVEHRNYVQQSLKEKGYDCYWITPTGRLEFDSITTSGGDVIHEKILQDGEYFIFKNLKSDSSMYIFGAGTKLIDNTYNESTATTSLFDGKVIDYSVQPSLENINTYGNFAGIIWQPITFRGTQELIIQEMQIKTLTEGDKLQTITFADSYTYPLNNTPKKVLSATFTLSDKADSLPQSNIQNFAWEAYTRLDLNLGPEKPQTLINTSSTQGKQSMTVIYGESNSTVTLEGSTNASDAPTILSNYAIHKAGRANILVSGVNDMTWSISSIAPIIAIDGTEINFGEYTSISLSSIVDSDDSDNSTRIPVVIPEGTFGLCMILTSAESISLYAEKSEDEVANVLSEYNHYTDDELDTPSYHMVLSAGLHIIKIDESCKLYFEGTPTSRIIIKSLDLVKTPHYGVNLDLLDISETEATDLLKNHLAKYTGQFFYNAPIRGDYIIDTDNMGDWSVWYDYNNRYNKFVLSEINSSTLSAGISLTKSSRA